MLWQRYGISSRDVSSALIQAKDIEIPEGKQIIDIITNDFVIDNGKVVSDPVGAFSSTFTVNAQIVLADKDYINTMRMIMKKADLEIDGIIPSTLAEKNLVLDESDQKDYVMLLDIGGQSTDIGIFDGGKFVYANSIPVGGENITNDISIVLGISKDEAEKLKRQYGLALKSYIDNDAEVVLNTAKDDAKKNVMSSNIVEVIEARVEQIFELVNKDIMAQGFKQNINTVILTGQGITNISKSDIVGKITLNIPVKYSSNKVANAMKSEYLTAFALIRYIISRPYTKIVASSIDANIDGGIFKKILEKVKDFFYS